jgi:uncharacterized protein (DUF433 family)
MGIAVYDVLEGLASGMTHDGILREFTYPAETDIRACLTFVAGKRGGRKGEGHNLT